MVGWLVGYLHSWIFQFFCFSQVPRFFGLAVVYPVSSQKVTRLVIRGTGGSLSLSLSLLWFSIILGIYISTRLHISGRLVGGKDFVRFFPLCAFVFLFSNPFLCTFIYSLLGFVFLYIKGPFFIYMPADFGLLWVFYLFVLF